MKDDRLLYLYAVALLALILVCARGFAQLAWEDKLGRLHPGVRGIR